MLGGADNPNGELPSYITGADKSGFNKSSGLCYSYCVHCCSGLGNPLVVI